jgi:hypothetical protein
MVTACCLAVFWAGPTLCRQTLSSVRSDNSDWWSNETYLSAPQTEKTQHRELTIATLQIATIKAGFGEIARAQAKLGRATIVSRGDAAGSRTQTCYVTSDSDTHLVFEEGGEGFDASFYLFSGGPSWHGSELCSRLPFPSQRIQTASGLRLGLTPTQVEAVLGKPSKVSPDKLTYDLAVKKRTPKSELEKLRRQEGAGMSEKDFLESFEFYYVSFFVVAKFKAAKLVYLGVTTSETYP